MSNVVVLKIGGSFLLKDDKPDVTSLRDMAATVRALLDANAAQRIVVVVGGGISARNYIGAAQALDASKGVMDYLGVLVSRLNARVFVEALRDGGVAAVWPEVPESLQAVRAALVSARVVVLGGLQPGQSTTAVAALCAEYCRAPRVVYCTNVDGVYTADPNKDANAAKLNKVSYGKLRELCCGGDNTLPGQYRIMDNVALTILERSRLDAVVLVGEKARVLKAVAEDLAAIDAQSVDCGTVICSETIEAAKKA